MFKSKECLRSLHNGTSGENDENISGQSHMLHACKKSNGGFILGEIKVALTLCLLAGGSYLDLALLFETGQTYAYSIFCNVIKNWMLDDRLVKISVGQTRAGGCRF